MLKLLVVLVVIPEIALAITCNTTDTFPNSTASHFHHYSCLHDLPNGSLIISSMNITHDANYHYPLDLSRTLSLTMTMNNTALKVTKVLLDIEIYVWEPLESGDCGWEAFPTFGFTEDLDGCEMMECPLEKGVIRNFTMNVDMRDGAAFLDNGKLYQLRMIIKNGDRPKNVRLADYEPPLLGCTVMQATIL
ncbi:unnamed protein product [Anisakis simplex]|uniref:ML domain-containing protein n=2 Tax=Anisakis simplex TaxID=6269 RepID=A0A0M3K742_ANISI|nr:unnamed protein product [Anisakis simplex]